MEIASDLIQQVSLLLIQALVPVAVGFLIVWLKRQTALVQSKLTDQQWKLLNSVVDSAVQVAEQSGLAGYIANEAQEKKAYAVNYAKKVLAEYGLTVDLDILYDAIESAVLQNFNWDKISLSSE